MKFIAEITLENERTCVFGKRLDRVCLIYSIQQKADLQTPQTMMGSVFDVLRSVLNRDRLMVSKVLLGTAF